VVKKEIYTIFSFLLGCFCARGQNPKMIVIKIMTKDPQDVQGSTLFVSSSVKGARVEIHPSACVSAGKMCTGHACVRQDSFVYVTLLTVCYVTRACVQQDAFVCVT